MNHAESDSSIPLRAATLEPIGFDGNRSRSANLSPTSGSMSSQKNASTTAKEKEEEDGEKQLQLERLSWLLSSTALRH